MSKIFHLTPNANPDYFQWANTLKPRVKDLYAIGNLDLLNSSRKLAIVGSRIISSYGIQILQNIIPALVKNGITIISGGAFGVDYNSQKIALDFDGKVITVLGSGIENPTPRTNSDFFESVKNRGLLVSELPANTPAQKHSFVQRNRIIAGFADVVLLIEARPKSGALITADFALQQGKAVCCFPGRAFDYLSKGTNQLIKEGAILVDSADEILSLLTCNSFNF